MTITNITRKIAQDRGVLETSLHKFSVEASMLEWPPGFVPSTIDTELGNGLPFRYSRTDARGTAYFAQEFGCITLTVFND